MVEKKEIIDGIKDGDTYDFVTMNYYRLERNDLADMLKELDFAIYKMFSENEYNKIIKVFLKGLEERWEDDIKEGCD